MPAKLIFKAEDAAFEVDRELETFYFTWHGEVSEKSARRILSRASEACALLKNVNWFIDRRKSAGFSGEARIWIKTEFLEDIGKDLIEKTLKIAALNSSHPIAELSANVLLEAITTINPSIEYKAFEMPGTAKKWLVGEACEGVGEDEPQKKKRRRFFGRRK